MSGRFRILWPVLIFLVLGYPDGGQAGMAQASSIVRVTDFGLKPDSRKNAVPAVIKALQACRRFDRPVLLFPEGRYDFWPVPDLQKEFFESNTTDNNPKRLAVFVDAFSGLTVDGDGSNFVFHDRIQPLTVDRSSEVTIRNLTIDWDVPLSAEAVVEAANEESLDLRVDVSQFPYLIEGGKLVFVGEGWQSAWWGTMEFDRQTLQVVPQTGDAGCLGRGWDDYRAEELEKGLVARFMHEQSTGLRWGHPGDRVGFIENDSMRTIGEGECVDWEARDRDTFEIRFRSPIPTGIEPGDALENVTWSPDVEIRGCRFDSNRARGVLISTPGRVVIEENRFESSGSAILIAGDANQWYESGAVRDVTIRNFFFAAPCLTSMYQFCEGIISIFPEIPKPDPAFPFHRSIRIEGNEFSLFDYPVLYAKSVDGLTFSGNRLVRSRAFEPFHARKATVTLDACRNVKIEGNTFESDVLGKNVVLSGTAASEVTVGPGQGWIR